MRVRFGIEPLTFDVGVYCQSKEILLVSVEHSESTHYSYCKDETPAIDHFLRAMRPGVTVLSRKNASNCGQRLCHTLPSRRKGRRGGW